MSFLLVKFADFNLTSFRFKDLILTLLCIGVADKDMAAMELGLAHSLSRYKLKFSPDKIDTMIVQVSSPTSLV